MIKKIEEQMKKISNNNVIEETKELEEMFYNAIDNGYEIYFNSPKQIRKLKYIKYAIEKGQTKAISYLIYEEKDKEKIDKIIYEAIEKGYKLNEYSPKIIKQFKYIKYAIEKGQERALNLIDTKTLTPEEYTELEEILYQQLKKGNDIIKFIEKKLNNFKFSEKISKQIQNNIKLSFDLLNYIPEKYLTEKIKEILKNKDELLKQYGKINTLEKNPVFSFEFVKYIYPIFGKELSIDLLKYNTTASTQIIKQIKIGNIELIKNYYKNICSKLFKYTDKTIHYAFRNFDKIKPLIEDINKTELNEKEKNYLKSIILSSNKLNLTTLTELKNYENIINEKNKEILKSDEKTIKDYISILFGYESLEQLKKDFIGYDLDNFKKINYIINELKMKNIFANEEIKIIILMKKIIETKNIKELIKNNNLRDYSIEVKTIIEKIRKLYNAEIQSKLTDIKTIKSKKTYHIKTITLEDKMKKEVQYEIIDMDSEKFNFLAHRIYYFDQKMKEFCSMLLNNPSLWNKLDGASTISTSSISDKGFHMINSEDNNGVTYLFNKIPDNFLLYMKGGDLFLEDGGHILEPTGENSITDINALNQASIYRNSKFNEVAGYRDGMIPCAIACVKEEPNDDQIRAAHYFKIPIIRFNIKTYKKQNIENYIKAKEQIKINPTKENIDNLFLSGDIKEYDDDIDVKYEYIFNILKEKYYSNTLTQQEFIEKLEYIQLLINRICDNDNPKRNIIKKIDLLIKSLNLITQEEKINKQL